MFIKMILPFCFLFSVNSFSYSQNEEYSKKFIEKREKYEKKYIRQAKHQIKKSLRKNDWWCMYSSKKEKISIKKADILVIPMFTLKKDAEIYTSNDTFFKYIYIWKKPLFHYAFILKNGNYYGSLSYDDLGCCGIADLVLSEEDFYPKSFLKKLKDFKKLKPEYVFYIRGILHAWWYVKDKKILVYYLIDKTTYNYHDFLIKYYPETSIRELAIWSNLHSLIKLK